MQIHPGHFIYAALCIIIAVSIKLGGDYLVYLGMVPSIIVDAVAVLFGVAAVSFILTAVNVEVWDTWSIGKQ